MDKARLTNAGIDVNQGLRRLNNDEILYTELLRRFTRDEYYGQMRQALQQENAAMAFKYAHTLKGVTGNLSMTVLYQNLVPLVEELRGGSMGRANELVQPVEDAYREVMEALKTL